MSDLWGLHTAYYDNDDNWVSSSTPYIARGTTISFPENDHDLFRAIHERRATPEQLHRLLTHKYNKAGVWWGTYGGEHGEHDPENSAYGNLDDFQHHTEAGSNDDLAADYYVESGQYDPNKPIYAQVPVVMVGQRPRRGTDPWDPEIHNEDNGLMGNSSLDDDEEVPLHEVHYHTGTDWVKVKMPKGITVRASRTDDTDGVRYAARYYHFTDNPNFVVDPDYAPLAEHADYRSPGLWVAPEEHQDSWRRYRNRRYRVEFDGPDDLADDTEYQDNPFYDGEGLDEVFVPADRLHLLKQRGVSRLASTDGIRYAHVVEADVAEDLRRVAMPAPMPEGITFHHHPTNDTIPTDPFPATRPPHEQVPRFSAPAVEARHNGETVGYLEWDPPLHATVVNGIQYGDHPPEVSMIKVHPDYRRHGIATALFDFARQHQGDLEHSDSRTGLGNLWVDYEQSRKNVLSPRTAAGEHWDALHAQHRADLDALNGYLRDGIHHGLDMTADSIEYHPEAHRIEHTPRWAAEALALNTSAGFHRRIQARALQYEHVLSKAAKHGPLAEISGRPLHQLVEDHRNKLRIELQHGYKMAVPDLSQVSRLVDPAEVRVIETVNPRYFHGTGGRTTEAHNAYKVNCQRSVLALDARHRGFNVEARPNFRDPGNSQSDEQFNDQDIAEWWHDADGLPAAWQDAEDVFGHLPADARRWDAMTDHIASWGPGARGAVAVTRRRPAGVMRHIVHARVNPSGLVNFEDPQDPHGAGLDDGGYTGGSPANHWRTHTAYDLPIYSTSERKDGDSLYADPGAQIRHRNKRHSPLRFLRLDDKELHPSTARLMVDRGSAGPNPIPPPPADIIPD